MVTSRSQVRIECISDRDFLLAQWKKIVEILEYASGEATFQQDVRYQKVQLIRHLSVHRFFDEALESYWHFLLPSLELQKSRIQRVDVDKISELRGTKRTTLVKVNAPGCGKHVGISVEAEELESRALPPLQERDHERHVLRASEQIPGIRARAAEPV